MGKIYGVEEAGWNRLSGKHLFMMWHAGLRGGIALVLSLELGPWVDEIDGPGTRQMLQTATFLLICAFLVVFGGSTTPFLRALKIPHGEEQPPDVLSKTENYGALRGFMQWVDQAVLGPLLIGHAAHDHSATEEEKDVED